MNLATPYSPWDLLPAPEPCSYNPPEEQFYDSVAKPLIPDVIRIMNNGIPIDLEQVKEVETTIDKILEQVDTSLQNNSLIRKYLILRYKNQKSEYIEEQRAKLKLPQHFLKPFDSKSPLHRAALVKALELAQIEFPEKPTEEIIPGLPKWSAKQLKALSSLHPVLELYNNNRLQPNNSFALAAMKWLAETKAQIYNAQIYERIKHPENYVELPKFNVGSSLQKKELFDMLELTSEAQSKTTGDDSWNRDQIERINKETQEPEIRELTQAMIDYSFGAIVKQNFIRAFYERTASTETGTRLFGSLTLFGAKTFRLTSQAPNLLNLPSTRSIYAKPIKKCLVAPPGYVILTADFNALEDRVIASLTRDKNKCAIFTDGLDGHSMNALGYFYEEISEHMTITNDMSVDAKTMFEATETNKALKDIRQKSKPVTFGLSYGAHPPKVAATLKISLAAAKAIFDNYHNVLYPGVTDYRENYVLPTAKKNGKIHLGLGCYLRTNNPEADIRTLTNATCQFWSILTLLTINKLHHLIDREGYANDIQCISTIYDSIYFIVREDPTLIKWLNDHLITLMTKDFMVNQTIHNTAEAEVGRNWADLHKIHNNATEDEIKEVLAKL